MKYIANLLVIYLFICCGFANADFGQMKPPKAGLIGGKYVDLTNTPFALIASTSQLCSGTLIGSRIVLTAAHCIDQSLDISEFQVFVGGYWYNIIDRQNHPDWEPLTNRFTDAAHTRVDLGILILDNDVLNVSAIPVLTDFKLPIGAKFTLNAFGLTEDSFYGEAPFEGVGKKASFILSGRSPGILQTKYSDSKTNVCSGDSGSGLLFGILGQTVVAGLTSAGSFRLTSNSNACEAGLQSGSDFVDLSSDSSIKFLSQFIGIEFLSGQAVTARSEISIVLPALINLSKQKNFDSVKRKTKRLVIRLNRLQPVLDKDQSAIVSSAVKYLRRAAKSKSAASARSNITYASYILTRSS